MPAEKLSVSLDSETVERARRLAREEGVTFSRWLDGAAREKVEMIEAREALAQQFAEHGEPSEEVRRAAQEALDAAGIGRPETLEEFDARRAVLDRLDRLSAGGDG